MSVKNLNSTINAFVIIGRGPRNSNLIDSLNEIIKEVGGKSIFAFNRIPHLARDIERISSSNIVIAEYSSRSPDVNYLIGVAHALGKYVVLINQDKDAILSSNRIIQQSIIFSVTTPKELEKFRLNFKAFLRDFIRNPRFFTSANPVTKKSESYIIDLEKLEPREFDNLCFELISQMGFNKVTWGKEIKEVDLIATLPKKDPDGFDYQELWMVVTGNRIPQDHLLQMVNYEPEYLVNRIRRNFEPSNLFNSNKINTDGPITILFILKEGGKQQELFEREIARIENRLNRKSPVVIRIRIWDNNHLISLIQKYPQIAYKYFSEESRDRSKYRKTQEELYGENIKLSNELITTTAELKEEKRKRFIAEREMAWKDVAFKAAHKLGNPVDATDTFLQRLKNRISQKDWETAISISEHMDKTIEEAKSVIGQFKSLTKLEEIFPTPCDISKVLRHSCKTAEEHGVKVRYDFEKPMPNVLIDNDKMVECFNELVANALHWFNKEKRELIIIVKKVTKKDLPIQIEPKKTYLKIIFQDNGKGVELKNKEKIFAPFFTTYEHGSGIGLSIVKKIIDLHSGYIMEKGIPNEGAIFEIYLPVTKKK